MTEILVDANVLLRHLTGQPPGLARRAAKIMQAAERGHLTLIVTPLILAECVWVLETSYRKPLETIADALLILLQAPGIVVREEDVMVAALSVYRDTPRLDFGDAYLVGVATRAGPPRIASFDRGLRSIPGVSVFSGPGN